MDAQLVLGAIAVAAVLVVPGMGFSTFFAQRREQTRLAWVLDAAWIGLAINWLNVAIVREFGVSPDGRTAAIVGLALIWTVLGWWMACARPSWLPASTNERIGLISVCLAIGALTVWKSTDLQRPLHGYWYLDGADAAEFEGWAPEPVSGNSVSIEGSDSGAYQLDLERSAVQLRASKPARGQLALAMQGPVGSTLTVGSSAVTVARSVEERSDEGPVRRYLESGVAAMLVDVNMAPGETLSVEATGTTLTVLPGAESVWAAHATGTLRYVHYYQLLNQVENQVWAQEMLEDRWATLNQPPAWSPQLSLATLLIVDDMPAAGMLFALTLLFVGASAVRLAVTLAPRAPPVAMAVPAAMAMSHGLLMIEPGSINFPDTLFAAALMAVANAIAERRTGWIAGLAIAAGLSRWPGVVVACMLVLLHGKLVGQTQWLALKRVWQWVGVGAVLAFIGVATGVLEDLLFILYFETFPEHWHGDYRATKLVPRVPGFYALWAVYTGGGLILASIAAVLSKASEVRDSLRWLVVSLLGYSGLLATIDHHPTHYFLPLVAGIGVAVVVASDAARTAVMRHAIPVLTLVGVASFLNGGDVGLQPIEDMVVSIDAALND